MPLDAVIYYLPKDALIGFFALHPVLRVLWAIKAKSLASPGAVGNERTSPLCQIA
jgi:hypothetical protein